MRDIPTVDKIVQKTMGLADDEHPMLALQYSHAHVAGEDPTEQVGRATVTIAPTGGGSSTVLLTVTVSNKDEDGTALSDTSYEFDSADYTTLGDLVDAINDTAVNVTAWAVDAPFDAPIDSDNFVALSATDISVQKPTYCLYRDVSHFVDDDSDYVAWMRLGHPSVRDAGHIRLVWVAGTCTGATNGVVSIFRDKKGVGREEISRYTLAEAETRYINLDKLSAFTVQGPIVIEARSDDLTACRIVVGSQAGDL